MLYTNDQGLSNDNITSFAKDKLGYLWVGTVNGLNRLMGVTSKYFGTTANENSIPNNLILETTAAQTAGSGFPPIFGLAS
ncbi:MAG: hypothetical protein IPM82_22990 [Saprospiraceae bacterium]|nr:hypothetical protein [Saprospiraceae bacterium]